MEGKNFICKNCGATSYVVLKDDFYCAACGKKSNDIAETNSQTNHGVEDSQQAIENMRISDLEGNINASSVPITITPKKTEPTAILTGPANLFVTITPTANNTEEDSEKNDDEPVIINEEDIDPYLIHISPNQTAQNNEDPPKIEEPQIPSESLADLLEMTLKEIDIQNEVQVIEKRIETSEKISLEIDQQTKPLDEASLYARTVFKDINSELKTEKENTPRIPELPDTEEKKPTMENVKNEEPITVRDEKELEQYAQDFIDSSIIDDNPTPLGPKNNMDGIAKNQQYFGLKEPEIKNEQEESPKTKNEIPITKLVQEDKNVKQAGKKKKGLKSRKHFWLIFTMIFISLFLVIAGAFYVYYKGNTPPPKYDLSAAISKLSFELKKPDYIPEGYSPRASYGDEEKYVIKYYYLPKYTDEKEDLTVIQEKTAVENTETLYTNLKDDKTDGDLWSCVLEKETTYCYVKGKIVFIFNKKLFTITSNSLYDSELQKIAFSIK
ncbi:hypothetical protein AUK11_04420 [bacterium CG2_30_37_16]|nr:MAG: hypothetical protein AUK11_04420 [bacterium CG2_30_37_16]PIP31143.1 MAG: hypothetical protein COX25_00925 [bacterium (Candidatus Howlettbacteria) CG23_combo_of_CG06-09_8_20_14_all_37_9]PIX99797.1 MAG: hypothetical protein COZ22_01675 [bacterium (Candidatus Howlettbacteria) CG_4_10_14_3_um_filter_37_10]